MSNHTLGPWYTEPTPDKWIKIKASDLIPIALVYKNPFGFKKNAALIAAAPEMLEALENAVFAMGAQGANADQLHPLRNAWVIARAAIAKARGDK